MFKNMNFSRWVFLIAGAYGILLMAPMYFFETQIGIDYPPPITHPEHFYGFIGVTLAWQLAFLVISTDPGRYRLLIIPAMIEKLSYTVALFVLLLQDRVPAMVMWFGGIDLVFAIMFSLVFFRTPKTI